MCWRPLLVTVLLAWNLQAKAGENFRFAFLSDTHVGSSTGAEDLRAAVQDLNSMTGLSFVVLSGDITEYGSLEQLKLAKEILSKLRLPYHLIPGNHDTKWSESGATDFPRLWHGERFVFDFGGYRFIGMHEGPVMKMGDGYWAPQDVAWLRQTLKQSKDRPLIFVTHYPIDDGIANWYEVLDLLKQHNIQAVLCGHGHANHAMNFEGVPAVMGRSNLRARRAVGGFNLVQVRDGQMIVSERVTGQETRSPWTALRLQKHDFIKDGDREGAAAPPAWESAATNTNPAAYPRPGFSVNQHFPQVCEKWSWKSGYIIASSPALYQDKGIVGDASGRLYAFSLENGKKQWQFQTRGPIYSTPAVARDLVVVPSTDGNVYALRGLNGKRVWRFHTPRPIVASPAIAGERVYLGSSEGKFRALDLTTGKLLWEFDQLKGFVETRPLVYEGRVIFGAWDQHLYAVDALSGKLDWQWQGDLPGTLYSPAACWPVAADGKVFIVAPDRKMTALQADTGAQIWRTGDYVVRESIGLSQDGSRFYVRSMNNWFYAFSTKAEKPELLWQRDGQFGYDINSAMLIEKDGLVFYGTKNGLIFALDAATGALCWEHKLGVGMVNTLVPLSASRLLAADCGGKVALLYVGKPPETPTCFRPGLD